MAEITTGDKVTSVFTKTVEGFWEYAKTPLKWAAGLGIAYTIATSGLLGGAIAGFVGTGTAIGVGGAATFLLSNPVGWAITAGVAALATAYVAYKAVSDTGGTMLTGASWIAGAAATVLALGSFGIVPALFIGAAAMGATGALGGLVSGIVDNDGAAQVAGDRVKNANAQAALQQRQLLLEQQQAMNAAMRQQGGMSPEQMNMNLPGNQPGAGRAV